ncbi:YggT family protein [Buchananella hordeovulneris]|uniref:YggT family protein n=1 Tax=Buchananella hordeovulneris TaxID=52770 RepID=A0A1Q5PVA1_9ACTO|nr:YggT family protein [Buchananella hordeovulneris]MDO5080595.1 YggT family protein [Buchananella hordeovulneris]OKL51524.1 YggT family protein [Buchananella hordeovulneris]RRD44089.1 YggT family protein [Buchananella hordeovulneris]RRD53650.1 YggT family protein [Buchananella hordeovulneris]
MSWLASAGAVLISLYLFVLLGRVVLDWIAFANPRFAPRGLLLVAANLVYLLTDRPVRLVNRLIPPVRLGPVALDLGFIALFFGLSLLANVLRALA